MLSFSLVTPATVNDPPRFVAPVSTVRTLVPVTNTLPFKVVCPTTTAPLPTYSEPVNVVAPVAVKFPLTIASLLTINAVPAPFSVRLVAVIIVAVTPDSID